MADAHLTFEEMRNGIWGKKVTKEYISLIGRIGAHNHECEECARKYDALLSTKEYLDQLEKDCAVNEEKAFQWFSFVLKIKESGELLISNLINKNRYASYSYMHPLCVGARDIGADEKPNLKKLVDDENSYNSIELENGRIRIQLDVDEWKTTDPCVVLMDDAKEVYYVDSFEQEGNYYVVDIPDPKGCSVYVRIE